MNNKKCKLCRQQELDFTSPGSNNKAEIFMQGINYLTFGMIKIMEDKYIMEYIRNH